MSPVAERNLQRLEKVVAVDQDSRGSAESFHLREATKPLLTPQEGRKMVVLANQRLRKGDLEELFGVTLADKPVPSIPVMRHSSLKLDSLLGHGQFHAVYDLKDEHGHGGHHSHGPHSNFRHNTYNRQEKVVVKTLRPKLQRNMTTARQLSTGAADLVKEALLLQTLKAHPHIIDLKGWSGDGLSGFSSGNHDGFFMVLQELTTTLKDKLVVGGDWRDEALFLHERLGHDYAYGYYHHHIPKAVETPKDDHKKKRGFFASLFGSPGNHHRDGEDPNLHYRSPQAQKALLDKQHAFFCTRLAKCIEMADALAYMHDLRILHRDLKPANVGFIHHRTRQTLKVFDMDMSRVLPRDKNGSDDPNIDVYPQLTLQVGSRRYIGPEVARSEAYNLKSDVYSFGLIVWEMLSMHKPYAEFEAMSEAVHDNHNDGIFFDGPAELDEAILVEGRLRPTVPLAHWNQEVCDFVEDCWSHDVSARPTMKEALHRLQEIHATLSSKDCTVMVPASDKNQVCDMHDKTHKSVESETSFGEGPSIVTLPPAAARPTVAKIPIQKDASSITATSSKTERSQSADDSSDSSSTTPTESSPRQPSPAMKKSNSWCSLVSLGMVDQEDTDDDDEYFEEEGEGVERSPEGKQRSDQPFTV